MPRCTIEDIPNEILLQIVQDPSVQLPEQLGLSLTSRRLHSIAELRLHHSLTFKDSTGLCKFLRTISSRLKLGAITRCLDVCLPFDLIDLHDLDERDAIILQKLAREKGMSSRAVSELEGGFCWPYFLLLLHLLPKLDSLKLWDLGGDMKMKIRWPWGLGEYHGPTPVCLQSLSSLEMFDVLAAGDVWQLISLPTLNSFQAVTFWGRGRDAIRWDEGDAFRSSRYVKRSSKLKELRLCSANANLPLLEDILQIPEGLDTFFYTFDLSLSWAYDIKAMVNALRCQANSLKTLSLTVIDLHSSYPFLGPVSFRDFPSLKELSVSCIFLLGHPPHHGPCGWTGFLDLLPSTLTSLTVQVAVTRVDGNGEWWMVRGFLEAIEGGEDRVDQWRKERGQRLPHLKTFSLWIREDPTNAIEELEALGITIDPRSHWPSSPDDYVSWRDPGTVIYR